jgi:predicted Fe-S protein YdhL (DUF1289 family)
VPLEGHFKRVNTPVRQLTRRERNVVAAGAAITFIALAVLILATAGNSQPPPPPGCISISVAGRTGAELVHGCGREAREICTKSAARDDIQSETIVSGCEERGIRLLPSAPGSPPSG